MKPSVFIDLERLRHPNVGLFNYCENLGDIISSDNSISPTFLIPKSHLARYAAKGSKCIIRTPFHKLKSPATRKFDVIHITHQFSKYVPRNHPNVILTIHDLNFLYTGKKQDRDKTLAEIQRKVDLASTVVSISDFVMQDLKKHLNLKGKKLTRIYNGVNLLNFGDFDQPTYRPSSPFLFSLGVIQSKKNTHTLPCLLVGNDYELILAGMPDENYVKKIKQEAARHNVLNRVKIIGPISEQDKYWYYKNCLAYMQPSLSEGFGLPVIEAMNLGKPIFLSNKTCLPEIGGDSAFYFKTFSTESMQHTLTQGLTDFNNDPTLKTKLIERANTFTWKRAGQEYIELYHKSLST